MARLVVTRADLDEPMLVLSAQAEVICTAGGRVSVEPGEQLGSWAGLTELLEQCARDHRAVSGPVDVPGVGTVELSARPLQCPEGGRTWVLLSRRADRHDDGDVVERLARAASLIREAHAALESRHADVLRLQRLADKLLELGPPAIVVDDGQRVRGWSRAVEAILGISADRAIGKPISTVLPDSLAVRVEPLDGEGSSEGDVLVLVDH
jgi:PAS domain-containing protein